MTDKAIGELLSRWDLLVNKLNELCPKAYRLYMRQAVYVDGILPIVLGVVLLCAAVYCLPKALAGYRRALREERYLDADLGWMAAVIVSCVAAVAAAGFLVDGIMHLLNPEYYALRGLIETFLK